MAEPRLKFRAVGLDNWRDLERLFESRGGPKSCWCMVWRATPAEARQRDGKSRKAALCSHVAGGMSVGILGHLRGEPVAWCSIAPRPTYRRLGGPDDFEDNPDAVWSLVCFFVKRELRGRGATEQLLAAAIKEARRHRAKIVEAYPVDRQSPSYRFMGFVDTFREAGFRKVGTAGLRRHVLRLALR
jgi:GNAT superfamily N-acetyltransferase